MVNAVAVGLDSDTVNVMFDDPLSGSVRLGLVMDTVGAESSLVIVPVAVPSRMVAFAAPERPTVKVSFDSNVVSPLTSTEIVFEVSFARNVTTPALAV